MRDPFDVVDAIETEHGFGAAVGVVLTAVVVMLLTVVGGIALIANWPWLVVFPLLAILRAAWWAWRLILQQTKDEES